MQLVAGHPCVGVGDDGDVPVAGDLCSEVEPDRAVERTLDVVALDDPIAGMVVPEVRLYPAPESVAVSSVVTTWHENGHGLVVVVGELGQPRRVDVAPVTVVFDRRDVRLVLVGAVERRIDQRQMRGRCQARCVDALGPVAVFAAVLAERGVQSTDDGQDGRRVDVHEAAARLVPTQQLAERFGLRCPVARAGLEAVDQERLTTGVDDFLGPAFAYRPAVIVGQEDVLDA